MQQGIKSSQSGNHRFVQNQGRPRIAYEQTSQKMKKRRIQEIAKAYSKEELSEALKVMVGNKNDKN